MTRLATALSVFLVIGCATVTPGPAPSGVPLDFTLPRYPGKATFSLNSERGKVVLLDVWATWCEPCRRSLPQYQALLEKYPGLRVYALNVDGDAAVPEALPRFVTETRLSLPVLLDTDAKLAEGRLHVKVMPTALLLDRQGRVRHVHEGFEAGSLEQIVGHLEALLAEP